MLAVVVAGVVAGFTYSLAGASLAVAYRSSRTLNFALGSLGGLAAYVCLELVDRHVPWGIALVVAVVVGAVLGGATDALVGRRLRRANHLTAAMGLFGVLLLLQGVTEYIWGSNDRVFGGPFGASQVTAAGVTVTANNLLSVGVAVVAAGLLLLVTYRTTFGLHLRAASSGPMTAATVGIRVRVMTTAGWAIGGALGAASAIFVLSSGTVLPTTFSGFIFLALVALTLGGLTSIWGVVVGGVLFGVVLNITEAQLSTRLTYVFAYVFLAALLLCRPQGLLGRPERRISEPSLLSRPTQRALLQRGRTATGIGDPGLINVTTDDPGPARRGLFPLRDVVAATLVIGLLFLLWFDGPTLVSLSLTQVLSTFIAVIGLDILMGYCGQISLAHGAFLGVGAYGSAIAVTHLGLPLALAFPVGMIVAAVVGMVVGLPAIRLSGLYFAQLTLLFALVVPELITYLSSLTGGSNGLAVPQFSLSSFQLFLLYGAIALAVSIVVRFMVSSSLGRRWRALRDDPAAAAGVGQRVNLTKLGAFGIGCGLAGLGGVMQAIAVGNISPDSYPVWESIYLQAAQVVGGMTSLVGNLLGAFFVTTVPAYTGGSRVPPDLIFGALFVLVLLISPRGVGAFLTDGWNALWDLPERRRHRRAGAGTSDTAAAPVPARPAAPPARGAAPAPPTTTTPVLAVEGLRAGYAGGEVLHGVDLSVGAREVVAVVGPNGAGKTTMLRAVTGLVVPSEGSVRLHGDDITGCSPFRLARRGVAHVVEGRGVFPDLTVAENLRLGKHYAVDTGRSIESAVELFPILGKRMGQLGGTLSGGEQQMLALARAQLLSPALLIMDEPLLGLAPSVADSVFEGLQAIGSEDIAVLIVEQNVRQVLTLCDRALVMASGRIAREGTPEELAADNELAETYFGLRATAL